MAKLPIRPIPSDDFVVTENGVEYHTHEGEWVQFPPTLPIAEYQALARFYGSLRAVNATIADDGADADQSDAAKAERAAAATARAIESLTKAGEQFDEACVILARRVRGWNWTDNDGVALPDPHNQPDAIRALTATEMYYLLNLALNGQAAVAAKNADAPAPTTSSDGSTN